MLYYARYTTKKNTSDLFKQFKKAGASNDQVIIDRNVLQKVNGSVYTNLKERLLDENEALCIDSLSSLGKNNREIYKELSWFQENNIPLHIINIPASFQKKCDPVELLTEAYFLLAETEIENVRTMQKKGIRNAQENQKPLGRTKIPYPDNWDENYRKWEKKEISSSEFIKKTGLKKGTFYNLLKQYRKKIAVEKEA